MTWIYYTGTTPEAEREFWEDCKDADRIKLVTATGHVLYAEYVDSDRAEAAWRRHTRVQR